MFIAALSQLTLEMGSKGASSGSTPKRKPVSRVPTFPILESSSTRSLPHSPTSHGSSQSSLFLSPPMTDSDPEEVPYKPTADDNISLDMHNTRRRRIKSKRRKSARPAAVSFPDLLSNPLLTTNKAQYRTTAASSLKSWTSQSDADDSLEAINVNTRLRSVTLSLRNANLTNDNADAKIGKGSMSGSLKRIRGLTMSKVQSWHKTDGESLTEGLISKKSRRQSLFGAGLCPSTTFVMAVANNSLEGRECFSMDVEEGKVAPTAAHNTDIVQRNRARSRRIKSSQAPNYDTPATITLRKASRIYHCDRAPPNQSSTGSQDITRLGSTLMALSTDTTPLTNGSCDSHLNATLTVLEQAIHQEMDENSVPPLARRASATKFCDPQVEGLLECKPTAAEPALTFAEVHTTPKMFSSHGGSRKHSILAIETMRRTSTVQIRSGGSIHEIIWDKEDSPSTRTTTSLGSSLPAPGAESSPDSDSPFPSPPVECHTHEQSHGLCASVSTGNNIPSSAHSQPSENLIAWSWRTEKVGVAPDFLDEVIEKEKRPIIETAGQAKSKRGRWSKSWETPVVSKKQEIVSFPPLLDRQSTHEWRKAPLVDLNDPDGGRVVDLQKVVSNPGVRLSKMESVDNEQTPITDGTQSAGIANDQRPATMGTCIGISEHHRRPSAISCQQRPHRSLVDLTMSVSRRASQISRSLSDRILDIRH